jgi:hypothetical protein
MAKAKRTESEEECMPGRIKAMIDKIVAERSKGNPTLVATTRTKLLLKGIDPAKFTTTSPDDSEVIAKIQSLAKELNVTL